MSKATLELFYVDDELTGGSSIQETIQLRCQLQDLFSCAGFELKKRNSNESQALESIPTELRESERVLSLTNDGSGMVKTLGIQWNTGTDSFNLAMSEFKATDVIITKRQLLSNV